MKKWTARLLLLFGAVLAGQNVTAANAPYFYPFVNPYEATVMELPEAYMAKLPAEVPTEVFNLKVFPERKIPEVFWYQDGLDCSLVSQPKQAPLIFVIAGTGSRYNSVTMQKLQRTFFQAGYHVVTITSPTHMDFVVNASEDFMPGHVREDALDLYRVMKAAWLTVGRKVEVSGFALAGFSLGGIQAAFVSALDEEEKYFNFQKVLLVNPSVSLYNSITILDRLLVENVPGGLENFNTWFQKVLMNLAAVSNEMGYFELTGDYLYKAYKRFPPDEENLKALIGLAFRMDSANMIFTADMMNGGGFIVPTKARFTNSTSLTPYALVSYRTSFVDYFNEYFLPHFQRQDPTLTREALISQMSLRSIEPYLRNATKMAVVTNEDDVILAPGEVEYLQEVFGDRALVLPTGGHGGNVNYPDVVSFMIQFLSRKEN